MPRMWYTCLFLLVLLAEIYIAAFVRDAFVRPFAGDVLVVILMYFFVCMIRPRQSVFFADLFIFLLRRGRVWAVLSSCRDVRLGGFFAGEDPHRLDLRLDGYRLLFLGHGVSVPMAGLGETRVRKIGLGGRFLLCIQSMVVII